MSTKPWTGGALWRLLTLGIIRFPALAVAVSIIKGDCPVDHKSEIEPNTEIPGFVQNIISARLGNWKLDQTPICWRSDSTYFDQLCLMLKFHIPAYHFFFGSLRISPCVSLSISAVLRKSQYSFYFCFSGSCWDCTFFPSTLAQLLELLAGIVLQVILFYALATSRGLPTAATTPCCSFWTICRLCGFDNYWVRAWVLYTKAWTAWLLSIKQTLPVI